MNETLVPALKELMIQNHLVSCAIAERSRVIVEM